MTEELCDFIRENRESFYRLAYSYLKNRDDALDAVHDAIVTAIEKSATLRSAGAMRTWFYRILVNTCLMKLRRLGRETLCRWDIPDATADVTDAETLDLMRAVAALEPKYRTVIVLRFFEDMSLREIAEVTGARLSTVKTRLYRALELLQIEL